jgi:hypothetical protein
MQGFAQARENPPAQEQWKTMKKTMRRAMETVGTPHEKIARRRQAPGANVQD